MRTREVARMRRLIVESRETANGVLNGRFRVPDEFRGWARTTSEELLDAADTLERFLVDQGYPPVAAS